VGNALALSIMSTAMKSIRVFVMEPWAGDSTRQRASRTMAQAQV
jgi:hypothetical protein